MTPTDPQDNIPANEADPIDLVPCWWRYCNFAFDRNTVRVDVINLRYFAKPTIMDGTCLVPECGRFIPRNEGEDWKRDYHAGLDPTYRLSTEVMSSEVLDQRVEAYDETEDRLRKAATQTDERTEIVQLEVARTVISLTQREAALVVYCPEEWVAQGVEITCKRALSAWDFDRLRPRFDLSAPIVGRRVGEGTVHAAIFPRIRPVSYIGWHEGLRNAPCDVSALREYDRWFPVSEKAMPPDADIAGPLRTVPR